MSEWSPISEFTDEQLVNELEARFDHLIFCAIRNRNEETYSRLCSFQGNPHLCAGLAMDVMGRSLDSIRIKEEGNDD